ncbi:MAG: hypothetical protein HYR64_08835 [Fimbriimonas ginsengisoli]|uniref:Uncharacterized protein n=1 Tax=Fimbriimonas ginsengisoli TaxID=1005039 RepID=A0A931LYN7_FIMGI|nr:hypothetical protein [Fimbriimonas ginsengisoli]
MAMKWDKVQIADPKHEFAHGMVYRAKVPGGWLITVFWFIGNPGGPAICFYPDPEHTWDGGTLDMPEHLPT